MVILLVDNCTKYFEDLLHVISRYDMDYVSFDDDFDMNCYDMFVLSGGKYSMYSNYVNYNIIQHCVMYDKPLIGICYGAEMLALYNGCKLYKKEKVREYHDILVHDPMTYYTQNINVFSSHGYYINNVPAYIDVLSRSKYIELFHVQNSSMYGMQFHPEKTIDGSRLLMRMCDHFNKK